MSFIAVAIGTAVVGTAYVGSTMKKNNKKQLAQTTAAQNKQETAAREASKLKRIKEDAGAKVKIGADDIEGTTASTSTTKGRGKKRGMSGAILGGVSASKLGGL